MEGPAHRGPVSLRGRPAGGGRKPPRGAPVKSRGAERRGEGAPVSVSGVGQEGERKRSTDDVSKTYGRHRNRARRAGPGGAWRVPAGSPGCVRHGGGASLVWASVWNVGTCRPAPADGQWRSIGLRPCVEGRSPSGGNREGPSTDAGHRGGPSRSSGEAW